VVVVVTTTGPSGLDLRRTREGPCISASLGDDTDLPKDNADGDIPDGAATRDAIDGGAITEHGLLACITDCTGGRGGATNAKGADTLPPGDIGASGACKLPPGDNGQLLLPGAATGACKLPPGDIGQAGSLLPPETTTGAVKLPPGDNGAARSIGGGLMERGLPDTITGGLGRRGLSGTIGGAGLIGGLGQAKPSTGGGRQDRAGAEIRGATDNAAGAQILLALASASSRSRS